MKITASNIISSIAKLDRKVDYNYINEKNGGKIHIEDIKSDGPIYIKRYDSSKGKTLADAKRVSISREMIQRYANAIESEKPINIDRVLGASYNTRSALESLLAYTPEFYYCYPGRIYQESGKETIEHGHKHLVWLPENPHKQEIQVEYKTDKVISEIPSGEIVYDALYLPEGIFDTGLDIDILRRHTQIQIALYHIGCDFGYDIWIAANDKGIKYKDQRICDMPGIIQSLDSKQVVAPFEGAVRAASLIDCIWFSGVRELPAVFEVEHTTGIKSGLDRMLNFKKLIPEYRDTKYIIVAADELRDKVFEFGRQEMYKDLDVRYFSYSSVEELYWLCKKRNIGSAITNDFLECYIERVKC